MLATHLESTRDLNIIAWISLCSELKVILDVVQFFALFLSTVSMTLIMKWMLLG